MQGWLRVFCGVLAIGVLSACSATQLVYNRADWFIERAISGYVSLDNAQEARLETHIAEWLTWHRQQELPRYQTVLDEMQRGLATDWGQADYDRIIAASEAAWQRARDRVMADLAPLLVSLSDAQVKELLAELAERNQEYYDKYVAMPDKKRIAERNKRMKEQMERWLGSFTPPQLAIVNQWAESAPDSYPVWFRMRERRFEGFRELVSARTLPGFEAKLLHLIASDEGMLEPSEARQLRRNRELTAQMLLALEDSLSREQRNHLLEELGEIAEDVRELIAVSD